MLYLTCYATLCYTIEKFFYTSMQKIPLCFYYALLPISIYYIYITYIYIKIVNQIYISFKGFSLSNIYNLFYYIINKYRKFELRVAEIAISTEDERNSFGQPIDSFRRFPEITEIVKVTYIRQCGPTRVLSVLSFERFSMISCKRII